VKEAIAVIILKDKPVVTKNSKAALIRLFSY
jgi:hypothetical protein